MLNRVSIFRYPAQSSAVAGTATKGEGRGGRSEGDTSPAKAEFLLASTLGNNPSLHQFRRLRHDLAAVSTIDVRDGRSVVVSLNDTCHLEACGLAERQEWPARRSRD